MKTLNEIVAQNLSSLRRKSGLTQQQLANQLNYSDKTISKWELGYAIPSVDILKDLADHYGVTVDYLLQEHEELVISEKEEEKKSVQLNNRFIIVLLLSTVCLLVSTVYFVWNCIAYSNGNADSLYWQSFLWGVSSALFISSFLVKRWWKEQKIAFLVLSSLFVWTFITAFYLHFLSQNVWYIYFIGVPVQLGIILISNMKK